MEDSSDPKSTKEKPDRRIGLIVGLVATVLVVAAIAGIGARMHNTAQLQMDAADSIPNVTVIHPSTAPTVVNLVLPGQTQAFVQAPIYAQTNGYLKKWYFDIGSNVKAGDVLAEIDTPTVDQQLMQAEAQLAASQATLQLARATYARQQTLLKNNVISNQDFDDATSDLQSRLSNMNAQEANVQQLRAEQAFKVLHAPFDGIVSARNTDVGSLINSGTATPLFVVSQVSPLRVYVQVPEAMAALVTIGTRADLTFDTYPGQTFPAEVVATSGAIDPTSRTMLTQLSVPNDQHKLFPGAYTRVHLHLENSTPSITVPANVLLFRSEGAAVGVVGADGKVRIQPIKIGKDLGNTLEVIQGLTVDDEVIVNPSDSLSTGDQVKAELQSQPAG